MGWKDRGTAPGPHPCTGNRHPTADREPPRRGGNRPQGQIHNKQQATRDSQVEDPRMGEPFEKNLQQREGDRTTSQGKSNGHMPLGPTGASSFPELDPNTQKEGGAEAREGCYPGGEKNKASSQYLGEPELPRPMKTVTEKRGKGDQGEKLDRDRNGGMQLKADLKFEKRTLNGSGVRSRRGQTMAREETRKYKTKSTACSKNGARYGRTSKRRGANQRGTRQAGSHRSRIPKKISPARRTDICKRSGTGRRGRPPRLRSREKSARRLPGQRMKTKRPGSKVKKGGGGRRTQAKLTATRRKEHRKKRQPRGQPQKPC